MLDVVNSRAILIGATVNNVVGLETPIVPMGSQAPLMCVFFCGCDQPVLVGWAVPERGTGYHGYGGFKIVQPAIVSLEPSGGGVNPLPKELPMCKLTPVRFQGNILQTVLHKDQVYVSLKSICEALDLNPTQQYKKAEAQKRKFTCTRMDIRGDDNRPRPMVFIPLQKFHGWLFSINPAKIKDPVKRQKLEIYQDKCCDALFSYWYEKPVPKKSLLQETIEKLKLIESICQTIPADKVRDRVVDYMDLNIHIVGLAQIEEERKDSA